MKKPKKITVKFFLNENLQPLKKEDGEYHPLYTQITYDRKNTQIKCAYGWFYKTLNQVREDEPYLLAFEERVLKRSVNYELSLRGDEFRLKGLGRKYENYCLSIHALFNSYLKIRFKEILRDAQPRHFLEVLNLDKPKIDFFTIYQASARLFDNMEAIVGDDFREEIASYRVYVDFYKPALEDNKYGFPVVIDWLEGSHRRDLENKLRAHYSSEEEQVLKCMNLIHKIISTKLELV